MSCEDVIGVARMEQDGTIVLSLRAEGPAGAVGHGVLVYPPSHEDYQYVLDHLGGLSPGEQKPVCPFPEKDHRPESLLQRVARLADQPPEDVESVSAAFQVPLTEHASRSNPYTRIFEAGVSAGEIRRVEYRTARSTEATSRPLIVLDVAPERCITKEDVAHAFGRDVADIGIPSARAPLSVPLYYEYQRSWGALRFGFARSGSECLERVVFELRQAERDREPTPQEASQVERAETIVIASNTQATVGDLRIGAGSFWDRDYTDEQGASRRGYTAMLWIFIRRPDLPIGQVEERVVVWPGKLVQAGDERFRVESVADEQVVLVRLSAPERRAT